MSSIIKKTKRKKGSRIFLAVVLIPTFVWFLMFFIIPFISVIVYSFTDAHMAYSTFKFVGLQQYINAFKDPTFVISLKNTVIAAVVIMPTTVILSIALAAGLNELSDRLREIFTFIYFLPSIISTVAISLVWSWLYHRNYGLFNAILGIFGIKPQPFLGSPDQALLALCVIQIWAIFGYYAVVLLAAMRGIDKTYYEVDDIDGASKSAKFFRITLPLIKNSILFVCIMSTISSFMFFTPVKILTEGRPGTSTMVMLYHILKKGIEESKIGYASAMSIILMLIIMSFSLVQWVLTREKKEKKLRRKHNE